MSDIMSDVSMERVLDGMEKMAGALCKEFEIFSNRIYDFPNQFTSFRTLKRVIASGILQETMGKGANFGTFMTAMLAKTSNFRFYLAPLDQRPLDYLDLSGFIGSIYFVTPPQEIGSEKIEVISFSSLPEIVVITGTSITDMEVSQVMITPIDGVVTTPENGRLVGFALSLMSKVLDGGFTDTTFVRRIKKTGKEVWSPGQLT
jgi:hypothetical protein